jgi:hypothetical protein
VKEGSHDQIPFDDKKRSSSKNKSEEEERESSESEAEKSSSEEEEEEETSPKKKNKKEIPAPAASNLPVTTTQASSMSTSIQVGSGGPTWEQYQSIKRGVAQLREIIAKKDDSLRDMERQVTESRRCLEKAQAEVKEVSRVHAEELGDIVRMVHFRDVAIADLLEELIREGCEKGRAIERSDQLERGIKKIYNKCVRRPCAFGATCDDHAIFLIHPADGEKYKTSHYACTEHAAGLIRHSKKGAFACPQCRYEVKSLRLECADENPLFIDEFLVKDDELYAQSFDDVTGNLPVYNAERDHYLNRITSIRTKLTSNYLPTCAELKRFREGEVAYFRGNCKSIEDRFYSKYPRLSVRHTLVDDPNDGDYLPNHSPTYEPAPGDDGDDLI